MTEGDVREMLELHKEWLFSRKTIMIKENRDGEAYGEFYDTAIIDLDLDRNVAILEDKEYELFEAKGGKNANAKYAEKNIHFEGEKADLEGLDLSGMSLGGFYFSKINANNTNFTDANLHSSIFHATSLENAIFKDAILTKADFRKCKLKNTDLRTEHLHAIRSDIFVSYRNLFKVKFTHYGPNKMSVGRYKIKLDEYDTIRENLKEKLKLDKKHMDYLDMAVQESVQRDNENYFEQFDIII